MSIKYKVISKVNPRDPESPPKYYAVAVSAGKVDLDHLSEKVADGSSVRQNDVYAVNIGVLNALKDELSEGRIAELGKFGTFSIGIGSEGVEKKEDYNSGNIKISRINFRPSKKLKKWLEGLSFTKINDANSSP